MPRQDVLGSAKSTELKNLPSSKKSDTELEPNLKGEWLNLFILLVLYTLQGIPLGMCASLTMVLKEKGASYAELGTFSLASWPFSLKLLWAPLVDAVYIDKAGRRKTWMVPAQVLIGASMLYFASDVEQMVYHGGNVTHLTLIFIWLYFLAATQDIAVDGWGLTLLRPENTSYASTCNAIGQTLGYVIAFLGYMVLSSQHLVTIAGFMKFWGAVFLTVTVAVALLKREAPVSEREEIESVRFAYQQMIQILGLRPVQVLAVMMLTAKIAFAPADVIATLQLQDKGLSKEDISFIAAVLMPVEILVPVFASKYTTGARPLDIFMTLYLPRTALTAVVAFVVSSTPSTITFSFYLTVAVAVAIRSILAGTMFVACMSFFARVSDKSMGGTYMTLMNTITNLGGTLSQTVALKTVDPLSVYGANGYYIQSALAVGVGIVWFTVMAGPVNQMQSRPLPSWHLKKEVKK